MVWTDHVSEAYLKKQKELIRVQYRKQGLLQFLEFWINCDQGKADAEMDTGFWRSSEIDTGFWRSSELDADSEEVQNWISEAAEMEEDQGEQTSNYRMDKLLPYNMLGMEGLLHQN